MADIVWLAVVVFVCAVCVSVSVCVFVGRGEAGKASPRGVMQYGITPVLWRGGGGEGLKHEHMNQAAVNQQSWMGNFLLLKNE